MTREDSTFYESFYPLENDYRIIFNVNKNGFNSEEFNNVADIVFLGCSNTYGQGVEKGNSWADIFSKKLNLTNHNLAAPALSTSQTINNFFSYVSKFGNPKIVCAIFPEFNRMRFSSDANHMYSKYYEKRFPEKVGKYEIIRYPLFDFFEFENEQKYFKLPLIAEEVIPKQTGIDISIQYIKMLELYCNSNNIKLLWGTWYKFQNDWIVDNLNRTGFKNFIDIEPNSWHTRQEDDDYDIFCSQKHGTEKCNSELICHKDEKDLYGINFFKTNDFDRKYSYNHWSVHRHIHTAEIFLNNI